MFQYQKVLNHTFIMKIVIEISLTYVSCDQTNSKYEIETGKRRQLLRVSLDSVLFYGTEKSNH